MAWESITGWLEVRKRWSVSRAPVFCTLAGGEMLQPYVRALLPRLAKRAGIDKRVHAHSLRHTFAVELCREGTNPVHIQRLLGHSDLSVTSRYLTTVGTTAELVEVVRRRGDSPYSGLGMTITGQSG